MAKYPSWPEDFKDMPNIFNSNPYYGFSSHATNAYPSMIAIGRGAKVVEVHFTLDKSMVAMSGGFDHLCSLDKEDLTQLVNFAEQAEKISNE